MKKAVSFLLAVALSFVVRSQVGTINGLVVDAMDNEPILSAVVTYATGQGTNVDVNGHFHVELPHGPYELKISSIGYISKTIPVEVSASPVEIRVQLLSDQLQEVLIVSDYAIGRETPVAYSNIDMRRVEEELASREMATIVNTTPGAYATQQGGGDGDARVTIRGFSQENVAVLLDGVPVNDMENGAVYWSNWFGLDAVMQTTQVQRGLGASKLAIPAIGGTINIITRGIEQKRKLQLKQEIGDNAFLRTTLGYSTGKLENGWGLTLGGSYKRGDGWVQGTWTEGYFYYAKVEKIAGSHLLSLAGFGAPQRHGQRTYKDSPLIFDRKYAEKSGVDAEVVGATLNLAGDEIPEYGIAYNPHVGTLTRYVLVDGSKEGLTTELLNERENYYHKPQISLKDVWRINDETFLSTVAYLSIGNGGGVRLDSNPKRFASDGSVNFQEIYDEQTGYSFLVDPPPFVTSDPTINPAISPTEHRATKNYLRSLVNNHFWVGVLSTYNHNFGKRLKFSAGIDARRYKGEHYAEVYDLLGADYIVKLNTFDANDRNAVKRVGDKIDYHNDSFVQWAGVFSELEWKNENWSGFISVSGARTAYKRIDYFLSKQIEVGDTILNVGYYNADNDHVLDPLPATYNGQEYTADSPGAHFQETDWYYRNGGVIKAGINRNISDHFNAFLNTGYFTKAPLFNNVFDFGNNLFAEIRNEKIAGVEGGIAYRDNSSAFNINLYRTNWINKPFPGGFAVPDPRDPQETIRANVRGMTARHMGIEFDMAFEITDQLTWEGLVSIGDWIWNSSDTVQIYYDDGTPARDPEDGSLYTVDFDAVGVHVGNAAQFQFGSMLRYEFKSGMYLKGRFTWFDRQYAEFNPFTLNGSNSRRESWLVPGYVLTELHAGYPVHFNKVRLDIRCSILNLLNQPYISDAQNNDNTAVYTSRTPSFDANSASVFMGQGRRFNLSFALNY